LILSTAATVKESTGLVTALLTTDVTAVDDAVELAGAALSVATSCVETSAVAAAAAGAGTSVTLW